MSLTLAQFGKHLDRGTDKMRQLSKTFCQPLNITTFGYVRIYDNGFLSWLTTNPDQDRFLIESEALIEDPAVNKKESLKEGCYLYFNDRQFPGCETFYRERAQRFQMDHGMVLVRHQKNYLETCCFSGLLSKQPLYQLFMNEQPLFQSFMGHFTQQLDRPLLHLLNQGLTLEELKGGHKKTYPLLAEKERAPLVAACGWQNLLRLSKREKQCLAILKLGYTYEAIGIKLKLSPRTVEHYLDSVKNKLGIETRSQLCLAGEKLIALGLNPTCAPNHA